MKLWRIAAETRTYTADDLSGAGAATPTGAGRWNGAGEPVVYCAPTIAMAVLETAAHIKAPGLPLNRFLIEINVPDTVWARRTTVNAAQLPPAWSAIPAGLASVRFGSAWLAQKNSPILEAPSVIVPEESITIINPQHPLAKKITARVVRLYDYSGLFR